MEGVEIPQNPAPGLDALLSGRELTLGKMAVLCRINAPILVGSYEDIPSTLVALWVLASPFDEVLAHRYDLETVALAWGERMKPEEYRARIASALDAVSAYYEMLPRPDALKKKAERGTGRSPSLQSCSAESTDGGLTTSSGNCPPYRPRSSGVATPRAPVVSRAGRLRKTKSPGGGGE